MINVLVGRIIGNNEVYIHISYEYFGYKRLNIRTNTVHHTFNYCILF